MAQPFDPKRLEFTGDSVPIAEQVAVPGFSASPTGVLAFRTIVTQAASSQLTWYDRKGNVLSTAGEAGEYRELALSPDATRVAYQRGPDLWLFEFARGGVNTKLTFGNRAGAPAWSPDGRRIVFVSISASEYGVYQKAPNPAGQEELLYQSPESKTHFSLIHDGRFLLYEVYDGKVADLWVLSTSGSVGDRKPLRLLRNEFIEGNGHFSPDGHWVAYTSNQSGRNEVYVLPFDESNPGASAAGALHQVSKDGGDYARWSGDGKELFYVDADGFMSVPVNVAGGAFQTGTPQRLFKASGYGSWDVAADGKKFLIAAPAASTSSAPASRPYHVVENWTEILKR
jgi:Tol biopolymer transport system component